MKYTIEENDGQTAKVLISNGIHSVAMAHIQYDEYFHMNIELYDSNDEIECSLSDERYYSVITDLESYMAHNKHLFIELENFDPREVAREQMEDFYKI